MPTLRLRTVFVVAAVMVPHSTQATLVLQPTEMQHGDQYRLAFTTSTFTDATSSDMEHYNRHVQAAADQSALAILGQKWMAIASTATMDARDNTHTNPTIDGVGVPVYLVNGIKIADDYHDLWDGTIDAPINWTEHDAPATSPNSVLVLTGTTVAGTKHDSFHLSSPMGFSIAGAHNNESVFWVEVASSRNTDDGPLYALSGVITVVPETSPAISLPILALVSTAIAAFSRRAHWHCARHAQEGLCLQGQFVHETTKSEQMER